MGWLPQCRGVEQLASETNLLLAPELTPDLLLVRECHLFDFQATPPYAAAGFVAQSEARGENVLWLKRYRSDLGRHGLGGKPEGGRGAGLHKGRRQDSHFHTFR